MSLSILDCIERAATGERMLEHDYDMLCFKEISKAVKEHDIKFPPGEMVPTDGSLIGDVWAAAMDVALTLGGYDMNRERRFRFTEEEIKRALRALPSEILSGTGKDAVSIHHRSIEDKRLPVMVAGGFEDADEELITDIMYQMLKIGEMKLAYSYTLKTIEDYELKGLPYEYLVMRKSVKSLREAARRAGKPGLGIIFSCVSTSAVTQLGCVGPGLLRKGDIFHWDTLPEVFKISKDMWTLAAGAQQNGIHGWGYAMAFYGGYAGGWEGCAVAAIAGSILSYVATKVDLANAITASYMPNIFYHPREQIYTSNTSAQVLTRHVSLPLFSAVHWSLPEDTEGHFYEIASKMLGAVPSGATLFNARNHAPRIPMQTTPLDLQFQVDLVRGIVDAGLKRQDANELAKSVYNLYGEKMTYDLNPIAEMKGIRDLYDLKRWRPKKELLETYQRAVKKLKDIGVPLST